MAGARAENSVAKFQIDAKWIEHYTMIVEADSQEEAEDYVSDAWDNGDLLCKYGEWIQNVKEVA